MTSDDKKQVATLEPVDRFELQALDERVARIRAQLALAEAHHGFAVKRVCAEYGLSEIDRIDIDSGAITRAPRQ